MRTHGWGGSPPNDNEEAIERIFVATERCLDRIGARVGISDVAREMGVTRQTVYRYFASTEELLSATARRAAPRFIEKLRLHLLDLGDDPAAVSVEAVAFTLERLPDERYVGLLLEPERVGIFGPGITSKSSLLLARIVVDQFPVDWSARRVDDKDLDELAELLQRVIQSFVVDPGTPPRRGAVLREYLWRWVAPAVEVRCGNGSQKKVTGARSLSAESHVPSRLTSRVLDRGQPLHYILDSRDQLQPNSPVEVGIVEAARTLRS